MRVLLVEDNRRLNNSLRMSLIDAKFIVAINPDENAPIMKVANFAVAADAREVLPAMLKALSEFNQEE